MASLSLRNVYCCGSVLSTRLTSVLQARYYAKNYSRFKEDVVAYSKFKKELRASRLVFQKELKSQQEMSMEEFNTQAAEEAKLAREAEEKALEMNRIELERMSQKRKRLIEKAEKKREEKFLRGTIAREVWENKRMQQRAREVAQIQKESTSFITLENMDQKIKEIIDNEVDYNFALSKTGEKITTRNK